MLRTGSGMMAGGMTYTGPSATLSGTGVASPAQTSGPSPKKKRKCKKRKGKGKKGAAAAAGTQCKKPGEKK